MNLPIVNSMRSRSRNTLVLGCTHYPLLARTISDVMGREVDPEIFRHLGGSYLGPEVDQVEFWSWDGNATASGSSERWS